MTDKDYAEELAHKIDGWWAHDDLTTEMQRAVVWLLRKYAEAQKETPDLSDQG